MKPRPLALFIGVILAGAVAGWMWFGGQQEAPSDLEASESPGDGSAMHRPPRPSASPEPPAQGVIAEIPSRTAALPNQTLSSVVPGMPMTSSSPNPALAAVVNAAPMARPTIQPAREQREGMADLENVQSMLRDFRTRLGENPVGTNAEIMKSIMGGNSAQARLGPPEGQSINEQGELLDRWQTPYFFHQLSKDQMEVRSAGPDRILWTGDDVGSQVALVGKAERLAGFASVPGTKLCAGQRHSTITNTLVPVFSTTRFECSG